MTLPTSSAKTITVFGGSGFLGRHIVRNLAKQGHRIRVAVRRPDLAGHLQPLGGVGQIKPVQANLRYRWSVDRAVDGADAVINCVGILYQAGQQRFDAVQAFGPRAIAEAARAQGITNIVHVSAIGADAGSDIGYLRSKGEGEAGMLETVPEAVILRPSIVFGPEDDFFNRFAAMARLSPALPLFGGGETRFQPVYVGDVAEAAVRAVGGQANAGTAYELGGPEVVSFRECMEMMLETIGRKRLLVPVPFAVGKMMGGVLGLLPKPPLTGDQVRMLELDNVVSESAEADGRTLAGLGISATAMEVVLPTYLVRFREHGQFTRTHLS
jgi:NADH dehydrogenase